MMTNATWKTETARNVFTPRSELLRAIDTAFAAYDGSKKDTDLIKLANAVDKWIAAKGNRWKSSTRNSRGTVENLVRDLLQQPVIRGNALVANRLRNAQGVVASASPALLGHGSRVDQADADGRHYQLTIQSKESSCGPCSVRTVAQLVLNKDIGEEYLRELVEAAEEGSNYQGSLGSGGVVQGAGGHDWGPNGEGTWLVPAVLQAVKINAVHGTDTSVLSKTTQKKPAIAVVKWSDGGLHYVVVAGPLKSGALVVLDPFYGVQQVGLSGTTLGTYAPVQNGAQAATGTWDNWVCRVV